MTAVPVEHVYKHRKLVSLRFSCEDCDKDVCTDMKKRGSPPQERKTTASTQIEVTARLAD